MRRSGLALLLLPIWLVSPIGLVSMSAAPALAALPQSAIGEFQSFNLLAPSPLVLRAQELLTDMGDYRGPTDGRLNEDTLDAVKAYQRRSGLEDDGRISEALLDHMEFTGKAIELGAKVERIRAGQIDLAEQALRAQPETRALLEADVDGEQADPTRDPTQCFAAPTPECLLVEALESAKAVNRDRFRDWVLGEILVVQAQSGLASAAMETAARIDDPRLIIVALADMASAQATSGAPEQALLAARMIPDPWNRAKALASVAIAFAGSRQTEALMATIDEILGLMGALPEERVPAQFLAGLAVDLRRQGAAAADGLLAEAIRYNEYIGYVESGAADDPQPGASAVAVAMAEFGRLQDAGQVLGTLTSENDRRPALVALGAAAARQGRFEAARIYAGEIPEPRYRAGALAAIAAIQAEAGFTAGALGTLGQALGDALAVDERQSFVRSLALSTVAVAWMAVDAADQAAQAVDLIPDARVKAEALWALALAQAASGGQMAAAQSRIRFSSLVVSIPSALDRTWVLCNAAVRSNANGDSPGAEELVRRAVSEAGSIGDPWARAQALAKVATTLNALR